MPKRKYSSAKTQYLSASESEDEPEYIQPGPSRRRNNIIHEPDVDVEGDVDMDAASVAASERDEDEEEDEIADVEPEEEEEDQQDDDAEAEEEEEELDPEPEEEDDPEDEQPMPAQPRLRIKLKIPSYTPSASATPALEEDGEEASEEDEDEEVTSSKRLTSRQAAKVAGVDVSHVSLGDGPRKKKALNETELALRREETARKRKNLSEKKLEDEKMETINRLLKKQTRTRNPKRSALPTPSEDRGTPESDTNPNANASDATPPPLPTMYRWVSAAVVGVDGRRCAEERFHVPGGLHVLEVEEHGKESKTTVMSAPLPPPRLRCAVDGCGEVMKYRLPEVWRTGACGMAHLKVLKMRVTG